MYKKPAKIVFFLDFISNRQLTLLLHNKANLVEVFLNHFFLVFLLFNKYNGILGDCLTELCRDLVYLETVPYYSVS